MTLGFTDGLMVGLDVNLAVGLIVTGFGFDVGGQLAAGGRVEDRSHIPLLIQVS
jgi:hypothetical protein